MSPKGTANITISLGFDTARNLLVDMGKAVRDDQPSDGRGGFHLTPGGPGIFSVSGVWGDATLTTAEKGRLIVEAVVEGIARDIEELLGAAVD
jgi:creatinine amidohydrolase/Fe(II)-dependent formamide hydrolase-like protein